MAIETLYTLALASSNKQKRTRQAHTAFFPDFLHIWLHPPFPFVSQGWTETRRMLDVMAMVRKDVQSLNPCDTLSNSRSIAVDLLEIFWAYLDLESPHKLWSVISSLFWRWPQNRLPVTLFFPIPQWQSVLRNWTKISPSLKNLKRPFLRKDSK